MATVRQKISQIFNDGRFLSIDEYISAKWIFNKYKTIIGNFLAKDNNSNKQAYKNPESFSEIYIPMVEVPIQNFTDLDFNLCQKLMKSKYRLPEMYSSKYGAIIKEVMSLNVFTEYTYTPSFKMWRAAQKQEFKSKKYYLLIDGYLYIPIPKGDISSPENIRMEALFVDKYEVEKFKVLTGQSEKSCKSPLDFDFVCPTYLSDDVEKEIIRQVAQVYLKITPDALPNINPNERTNPVKL